RQMAFAASRIASSRHARLPSHHRVIASSRHRPFPPSARLSSPRLSSPRLLLGMTDYIEHRKRLRERFRDGGPEALHDYEKLELLVTFAVPRVDVKPVAKALIKRFGGVNEALDASCEELESVKGLGAQSATLIRLVKALFVVYTEERADGRDVFSSPGEVLQFARVTLGGASHESFMVIYLNIKNQVIGHQIINEGTVDHAV